MAYNVVCLTKWQIDHMTAEECEWEEIKQQVIEDMFRDGKIRVEEYSGITPVVER